jgi:hypothetical protein
MASQLGHANEGLIVGLRLVAEQPLLVSSGLLVCLPGVLPRSWVLISDGL